MFEIGNEVKLKGTKSIGSEGYTWSDVKSYYPNMKGTIEIISGHGPYAFCVLSEDNTNCWFFSEEDLVPEDNDN